MKKAIIDQLFLGFLLLMGIVTFVATVNDETSTRNHIYDLKALVKTSAKAMAKYYEDQIDMCTAQTITSGIVAQQKAWNGSVSYKWWDSHPTKGGIIDGEPSYVTATIDAHSYDTFWYRFFDKDDFTIGEISWTEPVNTPVTVTLSFDSEDAGYNNMMGTYQLDNNNCVTNAELLLQNSNAGLTKGQSIGSAFTSPPTYVFLLSEGYDTFTKNGDRPKLTDTITVNNHCFDNASSNPSVTLNGKTVTNTHMYFEHVELNGDGGYEHIQLIPKNVQAQYESFIGGTNANQKYQLFLAECESVNNDNDSTNDIPSTGYEDGVNDCLVDGNNQYLYAMEDIDGGGDQDFNDLMLSSTRVVIPNNLNSYTVLNDYSISLTCNNNNAPTLTLQCPSTIDENTSTSFGFTASDSDGTIASTTASSAYGTLVVNTSTITYTPDTDFFGDDIITVITTDNEGTTKTETCTITVNEINLAPTISGNPQTSIQAGNNYIFTPSASDPDGDSLTFSISGKPSWASFDTSTGQLYGVPNNSNVGVYSNIIISVSDGTNSVSLSSFSIEVIEDTTNNAPECNIPEQNTTEETTFLINFDDYCTDSDGDSINYTLEVFNQTYSTENSLSVPILDGYVNYSPLTINVIANDGTDTTSTTFVLNISANVECSVTSFETDFSDNSHGWSNGFRSSSFNVYYINGQNTTAYKTYDFGTNCKNTNVNISIESADSRNNSNDSWENNDKYKIIIEDDTKGTYDKSDDGTKTFTDTTDNTGKLTIKVKNQANKNNERLYIDDVSISIQ